MKLFFLGATALFMFAQTLTAQKGEVGLAGMYSDAFHGRTTASGEKYDKNEFTGAHKTLPMGTTVKVTLLETNKSVTVRINDRGPYEQGRIVDLSRVAAQALGLDQKGYAQVRLEVDRSGTVSTAENVAATTPVTTTVTTAPVTVKTEPKPAVATTSTSTVKTEEKAAAITKTEPKPTAATTTKTETKPATTAVVKTEPKPATTTTTAIKDAKPAVATTTKPNIPQETASMEAGGLYKMQVLKMPQEGYGVQVAGYSDYDAVTEKIAELQSKWFKGAMVYVDELNNMPYYRVILGPFFTKDEAASYTESLKTKHKMKDAFVIDLKALKNNK